MYSKWLYLLVVSLLALPVAAQNQPTPLMTQPVDETSLVTLHGTVHPLVRAGIDRGRRLRFLSRGTNASPAEPSAGSAGGASSNSCRPSIRTGRPAITMAHARAIWPAVRSCRLRHRHPPPHGWPRTDSRIASTSKSRQFIEFSGTAGAVRSMPSTQKFTSTPSMAKRITRMPAKSRSPPHSHR